MKIIAKEKFIKYYIYNSTYILCGPSIKGLGQALKNKESLNSMVFDFWYFFHFYMNFIYLKINKL